MSELDYKIFDGDGVLVGSTMHAEDAAALVSLHAHGTVKYRHRTTVWREGRETQLAGESYDFAAGVMIARMRTYLTARSARLG